MTDIDKQAREILAREYDKTDPKSAAWIRTKAADGWPSLVAVTAALRAAPEGFEQTVRDAERYRWLQKQTQYRFGKIQASCVIDAVDVLYFKADEFDKQVDAAMIAADPTATIATVKPPRDLRTKLGEVL